jgi:hypothetical protein
MASMDSSSHITLYGLKVQKIGDEAVHFRNNTKNSALVKSTMQQTGLYQPDFGEGIYLGSAKSKWCPDPTACGEPDRSDCNYVYANQVGTTTAESVDIKEGTTNNMLSENEFEGSLMTGAYADSFVDVKGNATILSKNIGYVGACGSKACQLDGFQTHIAVTGWGDLNYFAGNAVHGAISGSVIQLQKALSNIVKCDNTSDSGAPVSNVKCQTGLSN